MLWDLTSPYDSLLRKWSKARQDCWDECERQFYYRYRATSVHSHHPLKTEIGRLRRMSTISQRIGEAVHAAITDYIKDGSGSAESMSGHFQKRWSQCMEPPQENLLEFTNGHGLTPAMIEQARAECRKLLDDFMAVWPEFRNHELLHIDNPDDYPGWFLAGGAAVYARPALAVKRDRFTVIDWKTGEEPDDYADNNLEMSASIFLACYDYNGECRRDPAEVDGIFLYLPNRKISHTITRSTAAFEQFSDYVEEKLDFVPESFAEEYYAPEPARWKCRNCRFATVCHDGKQFLDI